MMIHYRQPCQIIMLMFITNRHYKTSLNPPLFLMKSLASERPHTTRKTTYHHKDHSIRDFTSQFVMFVRFPFSNKSDSYDISGKFLSNEHNFHILPHKSDDCVVIIRTCVMYSTEYAKPFEEHCLNSILFFVVLSVIVKFNIISCRSVLLVQEIGVPGGNDRPVANN